MSTFNLTEDHIKLLTEMYVDSHQNSDGTPYINSKRPYGNSLFYNDIHQILTGEYVGIVGSKREDLNEEEYDKYVKLHKETKTALQIVLCTKSFVPGMYELEEKYNDKSWKLVEL